MNEFTPGEPWRPTPPPAAQPPAAQPAAAPQPSSSAPVPPSAAPAAPASQPAAPALSQQPAPQHPTLPTGPALHSAPTGQALRRAPFLEEQRPHSAQAMQQTPPPTTPRVPAPAPVGAPAGADAAAAFAAAAQEQLPSSQRAFMPADEPVKEEQPEKPAPAQPKATAVTTPGRSRIGANNERQEGDLDINAALRQMIQVKASDLHLTTGVPPMVRLDGGLTPLEGFGRLTPESLHRSLYGILTQAQREKFEEELELDFSYSVVGEARFRVNLYRQRDSLGAAFRVIPYEIKPLEALGIPEVVADFAQLPRGLVLVTGPTGSGKSTTLASLVDLANRSRSAHIMTVEDPIEFLHRHKRSIVNQREVGADTRSFGKALKHVLRQDPDIILIGEMRDLETISVALTAAETGHLVFATLHTQSAPQTMDRIIDVFPPEQQGQVRTQLAAAIQGVLCQTLLKRADGPGRAVAVEVMVATPGIRNLIREGKTHQIFTSMQGGASQGMQTMDSHLAELVKSGKVDYDVAVEMAQSYEEFNRLCGRHGR
ncbi:type IV pilus twitching motility protein PilT [Demequina maris]|uniref:type IV pilus twitching motility protein PilT n=1 Tax=Demequina maris TaxID=1638982 RepID=UPI000A8CB18F|nr:type IV pilus twitching motility protein PilT [Demequina maris]